tara:strand:- start:2986 stop:4185 length:1200 start_codon:yes stop_codon:yes gene_type:complete
MNIGIVTRKNDTQAGGDIVALENIAEGFRELGYKVFLGPTPESVIKSDFIFLSNTCLDLTESINVLKANRKQWGIIGFHEDFAKYYSDSMGFCKYLAHSLHDYTVHNVPITIEKLLEVPEIFRFLNEPYPPVPFMAYETLKSAQVCVATSITEEKTMLKDSPTANTIVSPLSTGVVSGEEPYSDEFLTLTGLTKGEYVLQVGRLETRKNQLATILAMRNINKPLVFIATKGYVKMYEDLVIRAIVKYRKAPTYIISEELPTEIKGQLRIIQMPNQEKLPKSCIISAFQNAGLHCHPAFYETPGFTYLEASRLGIASVASSWGSFKDYCKLDGNSETLNGLIKYEKPYDINGLEKAIKNMFGKYGSIPKNHPILFRTNKDTAMDIVKHVQILKDNLQTIK